MDFTSIQSMQLNARLQQRASNPSRRDSMEAKREALRKELEQLNKQIDLEASKLKSAQEAREKLRQREHNGYSSRIKDLWYLLLSSYRS